MLSPLNLHHQLGGDAGPSGVKTPPSATSAASHPCSEESSVSTTSVVSRYGYDLERDNEVMNKIEDVLGRRIPEEVMTAVGQRETSGRSSTVLQLAAAVDAECGPAQSDSDDGDGRGEGWGQEGSSEDPEGLEDLLEGSGEGSQGEDGALGSFEEGEDSCDWEDSSSCPPLGGTPPRSSVLHTPSSSASKRERDEDDRGTGDQASCSSPRADLAQQGCSGCGGEPASRTTPKTSVPSLSLGMLRKSIRVGPGPNQFTLRTRRGCDTVLDPSMLRVLLPLVARKGAASKAARAAAGGRTTRRHALPSERLLRSDHAGCEKAIGSSRGARLHRDKDGMAGLLGLSQLKLSEKLEACAGEGVHTGSRVSGVAGFVGESARGGDDTAKDGPDQTCRASRVFAGLPPGSAASKSAVHAAAVAARGGGAKLSLPSAISEEEDVRGVPDTRAHVLPQQQSQQQAQQQQPQQQQIQRTQQGPSVGRRHGGGKTDGRRISVAPHALGPAWWADYAEHEIEQEEHLLLPESMWSIHSLLQPGSSDRVSPRLSGRCQLAQTAFSIVYTATMDGDKTVVVKVLDVGNEDLMANAFAEANVLDSLKGWPGCVQMLACGRTADGQVQLVLQRADTTLRRWADEHPQRHTPAWALHALRVFEKAANLVKELHQMGVAHCDLKLDNLLLLEGDLKLSDFSEALAFMRPEQAVLKESRGTEAYQCPEMFKGSGADTRAADVWALGCLLYELLTGSVLFPGAGDCLRPTLEMNGVWLNGSPTWLREHEVSRMQHALCDSQDGCTSARTGYVLSLMCDILVKEGRRPTAAQVAVRASGILGRFEQLS